jgi:hypothetical protein
LGHSGFAEMTIRALVILVAICFSANAFAKDKLPKVGNKPLVLVKPKEPTGCKLVGTVKGTKLWAGDCVASELRGGGTRRTLRRSARREVSRFKLGAGCDTGTLLRLSIGSQI